MEQLAGYTSEHAAYHHGEASLNGAIIGMAQDFIGSNNLNLLMPNGQFGKPFWTIFQFTFLPSFTLILTSYLLTFLPASGTRLMGGKDAASPRYVFTQLMKITELIYHPDDAPLLHYEEGEEE